MRTLALALFFFAVAVQAQRSPAPKSNVGTEVHDPLVDFRDSMSDYFRQSRRAVDAINEKGIPDQEIPAVLFIARRSSASPNSILAARKSGKSWEDIARQNKVEFEGGNLVDAANVVFLSQYHGRTPEEVRALRSKGASYIDINQEFRRVGGPAKRGTERPKK